MEALYVNEENIRELADDNFELTAAASDIELAKQDRAKLYIDAESLTDKPAFYWFTDAKQPADFPVASPTDFSKVEGEDSYQLTVNISDQLGEHPS